MKSCLLILYWLFLLLLSALTFCDLFLFYDLLDDVFILFSFLLWCFFRSNFLEADNLLVDKWCIVDYIFDSRLRLLPSNNLLANPALRLRSFLYFSFLLDSSWFKLELEVITVFLHRINLFRFNCQFYLFSFSHLRRLLDFYLLLKHSFDVKYLLYLLSSNAYIYFLILYLFSMLQFLGAVLDQRCILLTPLDTFVRYEALLFCRVRLPLLFTSANLLPLCLREH